MITAPSSCVVVANKHDLIVFAHFLVLGWIPEQNVLLIAEKDVAGEELQW